MSVDLLIRLSVRLPITRRYSVETAKHIIKLFEPSRHIILFSLYQTLWHWYIPTGTPLTGASPSNTRGVKNISLYLRNDTRYGHSCYGMRIGNFTEAFEWCHFQWPWMTCKPDFKIAPLFDAEYLRNGTRCRHSFNRILIWLTHAGHALLKGVILTLSDLAKYSVTRSVARFLCDSWTSCIISQCSVHKTLAKMG